MHFLIPHLQSLTLVPSFVLQVVPQIQSKTLLYIFSMLIKTNLD
jgi:hypothetical protein